VLSEAWIIRAIKLWGPIPRGVSKNINYNWKISALGQCDRLLVATLTSKVNFGGVLTFDKIFTRIVLKESMLYRCYDNDALISCCTRGVSFGNKISNVGSKYLFPEVLPVQVLL
jgi:hypothetical protein